MYDVSNKQRNGNDKYECANEPTDNEMNRLTVRKIPLLIGFGLYADTCR